MSATATADTASRDTDTEAIAFALRQELEQQEQPGLCCQFLRSGTCTQPRPPCRFRHEVDDGIVRCSFGATCRNGHKQRVLRHMTKDAQLEYWRQFNIQNNNVVGTSPAERDATLLRSQLEPWSTGILRLRLASEFGEEHRAMDLLPRGQVMDLLLKHYEARDTTDESAQSDAQSSSTSTLLRKRKMVRVLGTPVDPALCDELLAELRAWSLRHTVNNRPSIHASSYMILRSPSEFEQNTTGVLEEDGTPRLTKKAHIAAKKLQEQQSLWDLAQRAIQSIDPDYAQSFSALAITKSFTGSPHIDKQNKRPFYGLSLGDFDDGTGGVCVEADAFTVVHVNTKSRLGKVDGRYPHWVAPYDSNKERYSLIFYSTSHLQEYCQPGPAHFGEVVVEDDDDNTAHAECKEDDQIIA
jgi:hypothetical protein